MKKYHILSILLFLIMVSGSASAARTELANITQLIFSGGAGAFVTLDSSLQINGGPPCSDNNRFQVDTDLGYVDAVISALMYAQASGLQIQLDVAACTTGSPQSPLIFNVVIPTQ